MPVCVTMGTKFSAIKGLNINCIYRLMGILIWIRDDIKGIGGKLLNP